MDGTDRVDFLADAGGIVLDPELIDGYDQPVWGTLMAALRGVQAEALLLGDNALLALRDRYPIRTPSDAFRPTLRHGRICQP